MTKVNALFERKHLLNKNVNLEILLKLSAQIFSKGKLNLDCMQTHDPKEMQSNLV